MQWPPEGHDVRLQQIATNRAWWSGEKLQDHSQAHFWTQPVTQKGTLWTPTGNIETGYRIHVPVSADLAQTASDFLFGGDLDITAPPVEDGLLDLQPKIDAMRIWLDDLLSDAAERASGMGEIYLRLNWEAEDGADKIVSITVIEPDIVIPKWKWGKLCQAGVWHDLPDVGGKQYKHVEVYTPGKIENQLWWADAKSPDWHQAGSLEEHPATADLEPLPELPKGMKGRMALVGVMNRKPRKKRIGGAADTEGSEDLLAAIDSTISSLQQDVDLAKARLIVDESFLQRSKDALGGLYFDSATRIFSPLNIGGSGSKATTTNAIEMVQFKIRVEEHLGTSREYIRRVVAAAGYAPESLVAEASTLPEAAAARRLREAASLRTTARKGRRWKPEIDDIVTSYLIVEAWVFDNRDIAPPDLDISLGQALSPDLTERLSFVAQGRTAGILSLKTSVEMLHPDWDEDRVMEEVDLLASEAPVALL